MLPRWGPIALISIAIAALLSWAWGTWPDVLVDFGRELYAPWRISLGEVLYRDIAWLNGPLSPYINAGWFLVFGVSLRSVVAGNLVLLIAVVGLLFRIVSIVSSRSAATLAALTCVLMFAFSVSNYNFIAPYSHELTHGLALSLAAIACFAGFLKSGRTSAMGAAGLALGLVFLTKAEVFLAVIVAFLVGMTCAVLSGAIPRGRRRSVMMAFVVGAVIPIGIAFGAFWRVLAARDAWFAVTGAWRFVFTDGLAASTYYRRLAGLIDPAQSVASILMSVWFYILIFGIAAIASLLSKRYVRDQVLAVGLAFALGVLLFGVGTRLVPWDQAARPLPVLMCGFIVMAGISLARQKSTHPDNRSRSVVQLTVLAFALTLLARVALNAAFYRYGFVLAMPATVVLVVTLVHSIPCRLTAAGGNGQAFAAFAFSAWLVLMIAHLNGVGAYFRDKQEVVSRGADAFLADSRAAQVNAVLSQIQNRLKSEQTLLVLPEGVMLNYLSRRATPTRYINFMPPELAAFGESEMMSALATHPADYVAIVHKDTTEYGARFFGRDYGRQFMEWVEARYRTVNTFGAEPLQNEEFGIRLLERRDGQ